MQMFLTLSSVKKIWKYWYVIAPHVETTDGETKSSVLHVFALLGVHLFFRDAIVKKPYVTPIKPL